MFKSLWRMWFLHLLFLVQICYGNDYGKDAKLTKDQLSSLPIPDLAPYDSSNPTKDALSALNPSQKIYVQSLFSKSIYFPKCEKPLKPIIQPIYFWPGKRVDLPCRMCHRSFVYNGFIKNWAVLRHGIVDALSKKSSAWRTEKWEIIDHKFSDDFVSYSQDGMPFMPQRKDGDNPNAKPKESFRPKTQFLQRDGKLIILHPHMDSYGLYRCFDKDSSKIFNFVYFLIPMTPIFTVNKWNVHLNQCPADKNKPFKHLDEFHQFRFLPAILPKSNDTCSIFKKASTEEDSSTQSENYCSVDTFNEISQPPLNNIVNVSPHKNEIDQVIYNLKIFISWSEWSSCNAGEVTKTRYGFCHIGKRDRSKTVNDYLKAKKDDQDAKTFVKLHKFLDNVEEFRVNGIRLFSGVLADIINPEYHNSTHCDNYYSGNFLWKEFQESTMDLIKTGTKDSTAEIRENLGSPGDFHFYESVCFRKIDAETNIYTTVEYGQKIIQNEPC